MTLKILNLEVKKKSFPEYMSNSANPAVDLEVFVE